MKFRNPELKIKAMAFGGCSFTWGQGLWYYSGLDNPPPDPNYGGAPFVNPVHLAFREKWRFPNIVADAFDTVAVVRDDNGGANDHTVEYWQNCFTRQDRVTFRNFHRHQQPITLQPLKYSDISHFVFQFTQWGRSGIELDVNGEPVLVDVQTVWGGDTRPDFRKEFFVWLKKNISEELEIDTFNKFQKFMVNRDLARVKEFLYTLEKNNIKTYIISWPHEFAQALQEGYDDWMLERLITFNYNGRNHRCIEEMMRDEGNLRIEDDAEYFETPIRDQHPSLLCHKIIAENIINFIKDKEQK